MIVLPVEIIFVLCCEVFETLCTYVFHVVHFKWSWYHGCVTVVLPVLHGSAWCPHVLWGRSRVSVTSLRVATRSAATLPLMSHTHSDESAQAQNSSRATTTLVSPPPPLYWLVTQRVYRGNLADQLRLLQLPQPGTHQHRPHTEDAVTPTNSLHQGDRPAPLAYPTGTRRGDSVITDVIMTLFWRRVSAGQKRQPNNTVGAAAVHRWRTADRTMDAQKIIEKSGSSLYARQPHLASTYGSKNSLTPPHST